MTDREPPSTGLWNPQSLVTGGPPPPGPKPPPVQPQAPPPAATPPAPPPAMPPPPDMPAAPPWSPPPAGPPPRAAGSRRRLMIVVGSAAAVLLAGAVTAVVVNAATGPAQPVAEQPFVPDPAVEPDPTPDDATPTETQTETEPAPQDTADPEQEALDALAEQHEEDLPTMSFAGQYAAQLASKVPGISDPYQKAADGTHIFRAADILAEHRSLRAGTTDGTPIVLLKSTDYGKRQVYQGEALWVTFAAGDFADRQAVLDWCARRFPAMSGKELGNQCAVRKLEPSR